jgi:phenylalanyl-tRNA synthetase beta chain
LTYEEVAKYPIVKRDFALLLDESISFEDLQKVALNTNKKILKEVRLFDVFEGKTLDKGKKSYGLSFTFQDKNKTLTDKQVDKVMKELQKNFEQEFDSKLR